MIQVIMTGILVACSGNPQMTNLRTDKIIFFAI